MSARSVAPTGWQSVGTFTVQNGIPVPPKPRFPLNVPGLYRLRFANGYVYIGQARNLEARLGNYVSPTDGTEQEHVIRYFLLDAGSAEIDVIIGPQFGTVTKPKGLRKRETQEKKTAIATGDQLVKAGRACSREYLRWKIKYHEDMLAKSRAKWNAGTQ